MAKVLESIMIELKSIRYLINNLIVAQHQNKELLTLLCAKENVKLPKDKEKKQGKPPEDGVKFDMFTMSEPQYNALVNEFGYDIVCRACAMLDDYIREKGFCPYGKPILALRKVLIIHALKEKLDSQKVGKITFKSIDHTVIDNKADAISFINSVPVHLRNLEPSVQELKERFKIND